MKIGKNAIAGIGAGILGVSLLAGPAFAEGNFTSSISGATPGFSSRTWTDNNNDAASTVVGFSGCTVRNSATGATVSLSSVRINLERSGVQVNNQAINCGSVNFGRVNAGVYSFKLTSINGATDGRYKLSVGTVGVSY